MKVIDLLNKIANGEEVPKKIKFEEFEFTLEEDTYYKTNSFGVLNDYIYLKRSSLNEEVEIIEEESEIDIQEIKLLDGIIFGNADETTYKAIVDMSNKIGELILAVKQLDNKINGK